MIKTIWAFCSIFFLCVSASLQAQDNHAIYFNQKWAVIPQKDTASFYRIYTPKTNLIEVNDFYINDTLQMTGQITLKDSLKTGIYKYYDEQGRLSSEMPYIKGKRQGKNLDYYPNGTIAYEVSYNENFQTGYRNSYDTLGVLLSKERFLDDPDAVRTIFASDTSWQKLAENDCHGFLDGKSYYYYPNGKTASEELYEKGHFVSANFFDPSGQVVYYDHEKESTAAMPSFQGNYTSYLSKAIKYPKEARRKKIEGRVIVAFVVEKDGSVGQLKVINSVHPLLDEEALRVVAATSSLWKPGRIHNLPIRVYFSAPIKFTLK
ncbi:hypothetical protein DBR32_01485 [Taibaiella sp. KBW10]|uniref:energy transducer TonB n=1 Tax=Taibaiella sp. KBW10 TaxID=2153357 RepID=UPI000F593E6F|nr:energy transducer TonB [Taibaiella sp. KBW10]RQO32310.1 hypothetical protein DBR32_01485 [Taibaiella sp. KBW10]